MKCKIIFVYLLTIQLLRNVPASKISTIKNSTGKGQSHRRIARQESGSCECGIANDQQAKQSGNVEMIIQGEVVKPIYKYPWMVGVFMYGRQTCGAVIIAPNYVLTAAHCMAPSPNLVKTAEHAATCTPFMDKEKYCPVLLDDLELRYNGEKSGLSHVVRIEEVIISFGYRQKPAKDDIALVRTIEELPCNKYTAPICLPTVRGLYKARKKVIVAGWGQTSENDEEFPLPEKAVLKEANLLLECRGKCQQQISEMSPYSVCCKESNGQACKGDSGGPLFKKLNGRYYLIGITSYGIGLTCIVNRPTYYTKVKSYLPWINMKTNLASN